MYEFKFLYHRKSASAVNCPEDIFKHTGKKSNTFCEKENAEMRAPLT